MTRFPILLSRIPADGFGRAITRTERNSLIAAGVTVPTRTRVVRAHGSDYVGALYAPVANGLRDLGVSVTLPA